MCGSVLWGCVCDGNGVEYEVGFWVGMLVGLIWWYEVFKLFFVGGCFGESKFMFCGW